MIRSAPIALLLALIAAACAPMVQHPGVPGVDFAGPRLTDDAFISFDGATLGLRRWVPSSGEPWAVIVGLHGINDYSNAFHLAGPEWAKDGIATYAYDQRGYGRSPHRGIWPGQPMLTEDLRTFCALIRKRYPHAIIAVAGVSMGGAVTIEAFASDRPPSADRVVLLAPAVWGWSTQPLPNKTALWLTAHVAPSLDLEPPRFVTNSIQASDNIDELRRMGRDPLMLWGARVDALYGLVRLMERASRDIGRIGPPTLYLTGDHDQIVPPAAARRAARNLKPQDRSGDYRSGWHLLLVDRQADSVYRDVESFIRDPAAPLPSGAPPIPVKPGPASGAVTADHRAGVGRQAAIEGPRG
jgi:alpha-beta hydrolase superfamily lysophospholipase